MIVVGLGLGTAGVSYAAIQSVASANASGSWTITSVYVPNFGNGSGATGSANLKSTKSNYASFNGDAISNAFGYNVRLVNSNNQPRSSFVGLYKDNTTRANDNSGTVGHYYYADVHSKVVEVNSSTVKLHFSADKR